MEVLKEVAGFIGLVLVGIVLIAALTIDPVSIEKLIEIQMEIWE